jgi:predicted N-acetyltransferase YhbS
MQIRNEKAQDRSSIATLIAKTYLADGARTIEVTGILRDMPEYSEKHAFIAEEDDKAVAYALFTKLKVGEKGEALLLAPLAVDTKEDVDVDKFLLQVFEKLKDQGCDLILMHGSVEQYHDLGFDVASKLGIDDGISVEGVDLLLKNISGKAVTEAGTVNLPECLR